MGMGLNSYLVIVSGRYTQSLYGAVATENESKMNMKKKRKETEKEREQKGICREKD